MRKAHVKTRPQLEQFEQLAARIERSLAEARQRQVDYGDAPDEFRGECLLAGRVSVPTVLADVVIPPERYHLGRREGPSTNSVGWFGSRIFCQTNEMSTIVFHVSH